MSFNISTFPSEFKAAEITPIFKINIKLNKIDYGSVTVLP